MPEDVAQLILAQSRGPRQEIAVAVGAATAPPPATRTLAIKLDRVAAAVDQSRTDAGAGRADIRGALLGFERDLRATERRNVTRHGETLRAMGAIGALERQIAG